MEKRTDLSFPSSIRFVEILFCRSMHSQTRLQAECLAPKPALYFEGPRFDPEATDLAFAEVLALFRAGLPA
jgi:hypothetical protein